MAGDVIEREFQKVYQELVLMTQESETTELQKLPELWRKCRDNENRLSLRCRDLQTQVAAMKARSLATAAKSKEDKATIASLKKELENAWRIVDEAHEKEQKSREINQSLQQEVDHLSRTVEHSISLSLTQERLAELQKSKDDLSEEKDRFLVEMSELKDKLDDRNSQIQLLTEEVAASNSKLTETLLDCEDKGATLQRELRLREKLEIDIRQIRAEADAKQILVQSITQQNKDMEIRLDILENHTKDIEVMLDNSRKETENVKTQCENLQHENDVYRRQISRQKEDSCKMAADIKLKEDSYWKLNSEYIKLLKQKDSLYVKVQKLGEQNSKLVQQNSNLKNNVLELERESTTSNKKVLKNEKAVCELLREKSALRQNGAKFVDDNEKLLQKLESCEQAEKRVNQELHQYKSELEKYIKVNGTIAKERDRLTVEVGDLQKKNQRLTEEIKFKESLLLDSHRKTIALEGNVHQQRTAMATLQSKQENYVKSMTECQEELSDTKNKLREIEHEKEGLKEEVQSREQQLFQEHRKCRDLTKEKESLSAELQQTKILFAKWRARCDTWEAKRKMSAERISRMGRVSSQQKQETEKYIRNSVRGDSRLAEKENEVQTLRKDVTLLQQFSLRNESEQKRLHDDIRILKLEIKRLKDENQYLKNSVTAFRDLQKEVSRLEKELMTEKLKNKGLELELENPHNVHRWRKLEGNDPTVYELLQKNRIVQKRLIFHVEETSIKMEKATDRKAKKVTYEDQNMASDEAKRLLEVRETLRCKDNRIKSLTSEQDVYLARIDRLKEETDELRSELRRAKMHILMMRKTKSLQDIPSSITVPQKTKSAVSTKIRSFGSGYRVITSSRA